MEPVVITGLGVVCSLGRGTRAFWRGLHQRGSRPQAVGDPHAHMALPVMYPVTAVDGAPGSATLDGMVLGRASRLAVEAAGQAVGDAARAGWPLRSGRTGRSPASLAVVVGTGMGDAGLHEEWRVAGHGRQTEWSPAHMVAAAVADTVGAVHAVGSVSNACAASGFAISVGADMIRSGEADVVLAVGAEGYSRVALACFNRLGAIDPVRCRPFDRHRAGTVFGEGAAALVLESRAHAADRGARPYASVTGAGWSCDAHHTTAPEPTGEQIVRAMRHALAESSAPPAAVGCVVPHGTGTQLNDVVESRALGEVLGSRCPDVPLYSLKALVGHTGGAAGALAAVAATLMVDEGEVPPNEPIDEQDPSCAVWLPQEHAVPLEGEHVLVNAYAFGGNNVSLLIGRAAA